MRNPTKRHVDTYGEIALVLLKKKFLKKKKKAKRF